MVVLNHLGLRYISLVEAEIKTEEIFMAGSEIMYIEDAHHISKILEVDIEVTLIIEKITGIVLEVVTDTWTIITITGGIIIGAKIMIEIGVGHWIYSIEVEEETGVWATAGLGQDQGQVWIEVGLDAWV